LQSSLVNGATLRVDSTLRGNDVVLVLGNDFQGVKAAAPAAPTTATTAPAPPPIIPTALPPKGSDPSVTC